MGLKLEYFETRFWKEHIVSSTLGCSKQKYLLVLVGLNLDFIFFGKVWKTDSIFNLGQQ